MTAKRTAKKTTRKPLAKAVTKVPVEPHNWTDDGDKVLVLRRINPDGTSRGGFKWPDGIDVEVLCPDWNPEPVCGGGLHGWPWGMGLGDGCDYSIITDRWLVIAVAPSDIVGNIEKGLKCKFSRGIKIHDGTFSSAWALISSGRHRCIEAMAKDGAPSISSGNSSTAASSGNSSKAASSGDSSKAASSGDYSKAEQSGPSGIAASIGSGGTVMAGESGLMILTWWNVAQKRYHAVTAEAGIDGIKADQRYRLGTDHKFKEVNN